MRIRSKVKKGSLLSGKSKYNSKKQSIDGVVFDSKKEAARFLILKNMVASGKIRNLVIQPEFILQESFVYKGKSVRPIKYVSDFKYNLPSGEIVVEDVKGQKTQVYLLKRKMFLKIYGEKYSFIES